MAVTVEAHESRPARSLSSAFELQGDGSQGHLQLTSPLGSTLALARWAPGYAELVESSGRVTRYPDLESLADGMLGERLPLSALPDWLRGRPWPGAPNIPRHDGFEQLGWAVDLSAHAVGRLTAQRASPPAVTVRLRLDSPA